MRRLIPLLLLVVCAQTGAAQSLIAVKGGVSISKPVIPNDSGMVSSLTGFGGGVSFWLGRGPVSLQAEVMSIMKGFRFVDPADEQNDFKLKLNYIEVPVSALVHLGKGPYVFGGPVVGLEGTCNIQTHPQQGVTLEQSCNNQNVSIFRRRKIELSAVAGAGFRYSFGKNGGHSILLEGRHDWGFTNINKESDTQSIKNRALVFVLGYATSSEKPRGRRP